jgi:hypothetical protein
LFVFVSLALCGVLFWAVMTERPAPTNAAARAILMLTLPMLALVATLFAAAWIILVGSFVFD